MLSLSLSTEALGALLKANSTPAGRVIQSLCGPEERGPNPLFFVGKKAVAHLPALLAVPNAVLIVEESLMGDAEKAQTPTSTAALFEVPNARRALSQVLEHVENKDLVTPKIAEPGIHPSARVHPSSVVEPSARLDAGVVVGPLCYVGHDVWLGEGTTLLAGAKISRNTRVGKNSLLRENCVVGGNGFGIETDDEGNNVRIPHLAGVSIGNEVEIGALTTVCSGTLKETVIEDFAKIDDHVHVAHNDHVERNAIVTAGTTICGSVRIKEKAWLGVNSCIKQGLTVGEGSVVGMAACVTKDVPPQTTIAGNPGRELGEFARIQKWLVAQVMPKN
ncbi:MAG: hypothetical protein IOD12_12690 [Silvanigrellales bacterium]|nr:hypothetical protein [Silvanigrellales bacterium]